MADANHNAVRKRKAIARKHGHSFKEGSSREYHIWENMRQRCRNPNANYYHRYGGRGISVCERWNDFSLFYADMGPCPSVRHSIDRIDNNGNYEPGNCRWATQLEQSHNSTRIKKVAFAGTEMPVSHAIRLSGISPQTFYRRIAEGWTTEKALSEKPYAKRRKGFSSD